MHVDHCWKLGVFGYLPLQRVFNVFSQDVGNDGVDQTFELNTQALMLIRFNEAVFQTCKNSLIKQLMITQNYGGKVIGLAHAADVRMTDSLNAIHAHH